jgi:hypothetical protein
LRVSKTELAKTFETGKAEDTERFSSEQGPRYGIEVRPGSPPVGGGKELRIRLQKDEARLGRESGGPTPLRRYNLRHYQGSPSVR